jgi:hypothetical protein
MIDPEMIATMERDITEPFPGGTGLTTLRRYIRWLLEERIQQQDLIANVAGMALEEHERAETAEREVSRLQEILVELNELLGPQVLAKIPRERRMQIISHLLAGVPKEKP